jgi:hypothetical protein
MSPSVRLMTAVVAAPDAARFTGATENAYRTDRSRPSRIHAVPGAVAATVSGDVRTRPSGVTGVAVTRYVTVPCGRVI